MGTMQKEEYLELGLIYAREGNLEAALKNLAVALGKYTGLEDPRARVDEKLLEDIPLELLSYYGLCIALVKNHVEEGIRLCRKVLAKDVFRPEFYLNLGKVYLKANQKAKALKIFQRGLELGERSRDLKKELEKLGLRKKQVFGFLPRHHFLNRYAGLLLHRLRIPRRGAESQDHRAGHSRIK
jgi:tetratricopeptide (TPR) repeat protein